MQPFAKRSLALAAVGALLLHGCATAQPLPSTLPDLSDLDKMIKGGECNPATAALIGAALGIMIADDNRSKGAAIGAGLGALACYIINAQSKQTSPPAEVEGQYRTEHQGTLPEQPLVTVYDTAFNAGGSVKVGQEARVVSSITLLSGSKNPVREVVEVLEVFESGDRAKVLLRAEKKGEAGMLTGGIQNSFSIRLPEGLATGSYPAHTKLYVNGNLAGENRGALRVLGMGRIGQMWGASATTARKYGEEQLPDIAHLLSATTLEDDSVGLLRDGTETLVGVLAMVSGIGGVDMDEPVQ